MRVSVVTPTYNRAHLIERVFHSLANQSIKDFAWYIIDDGSDDNTKSVVDGFIEVSDFPIYYYYKNNSGKTRSLNYISNYLESEFTLVFDSDDWCDKNAIERFLYTWDRIKNNQEFCSISALKYYNSGKVVGDDYSSVKISDYIERYNSLIKGDKWEFIRTDLFKEYSYPEIEGETYIAPSYTWISMARKYKTYFLNEKLSMIEYQIDGISKNNIKFRCGNPIGSMLVYYQYYSVSHSFWLKLKSSINYFRFHFRTSNKESIFSCLNMFKIFYIPALFIGYIYYKLDSLNLKMK